MNNDIIRAMATFGSKLGDQAKEIPGQPGVVLMAIALGALETAAALKAERAALQAPFTSEPRP